MLTLILKRDSLVHDTGKAYLLRLPDSECRFWFPKQFCKVAEGSVVVWVPSISWNIAVIEQDKASFNVVSSKEYSVMDMVRAYNLPHLLYRGKAVRRKAEEGWMKRTWRNLFGSRGILRFRNTCHEEPFSMYMYGDDGLTEAERAGDDSGDW